ncbi:MAG: mechanosensitive ion channel [Geminicoccaceae bacterium]
MTQRPFDVGDAVETAGVTGTIDSVTLFSTHLTTTDNKQVIVPNNAIWGGNITNATIKNRRRLQIELDVADSLDIGDAWSGFAGCSIRVTSCLPSRGHRSS